MLTKEQIAAASRHYETFQAWGGEVHIAELSATDLLAYEAGMQDAGKPLDNFVRLLCYTLVDESGARIFGDDDIALLFARDARTLMRLGVASMRINTLRMQDLDAAEKKSAPSPD